MPRTRNDRIVGVDPAQPDGERTAMSVFERDANGTLTGISVDVRADTHRAQRQLERFFQRNRMPASGEIPREPVHSESLLSMMERERRETGSMDYDLEPNPDDHVITVAAFRAACRTRSFIDYDGFGHPMKHGAINESIMIRPSQMDQIPADATHIVWYNR